MSKLTSTISILLLAAACGSSKPKSEPAAKTAQADMQGECVAVFQKQRECTDTFIPALVDLRAKHNLPPGIAQNVAADRQAVIAEANAEWKVDSTDEKITGNCTQIVQSMSPELEKEMRPQAQTCLQANECGAFVECIIPVMEKHMMAMHKEPAPAKN